MASYAITYARVLDEYQYQYNGRIHPYNKDFTFPFEVIEILWSESSPVLKLYDEKSGIFVNYSPTQIAIFIPSIEKALFYNIGNRFDSIYSIYWRKIRIYDGPRKLWDVDYNDQPFDFHSKSHPISEEYYDALMSPWSLRNTSIYREK